MISWIESNIPGLWSIGCRLLGREGWGRTHSRHWQSPIGRCWSVIKITNAAYVFISFTYSQTDLVCLFLVCSNSVPSNYEDFFGFESPRNAEVFPDVKSRLSQDFLVAGISAEKKPTSWCHLKSTSKINQQVKQATFHKANYVSRVPGAWCPWPMAPSWWPDYRHTTQEHLQEKEDNSKGPTVIYGIFIYRTVCH